MATLTEEERKKIWRGLMRYWSSDWTLMSGFNKSELMDAVDATDDWIDSNQVSFNTALPEPAKSNLSQAQKTLMFCAVALARISIPFLRKVFGEVDNG